MSELPNDTWISAYLDGELTAAERAEFERWLVGQPDAQRLLEELRAVSQTLQNLPRETLEPDFARRVLHQAELSVLLADGKPRDAVLPFSPDGPSLAGNSPDGSAAAAPSPGVDWGRWSRPLLWSSLAAAAALLIAFLTPSTEPHSSLARNTQTFEVAEAPADAPESFDVDADGASAFAPRAASAPPDHLAKEGMLRKGAAEGAMPRMGRGAVHESPLGVNSVELQAAPAPADGEADPFEDAGPLSQNLVVFCEVTPRAAQENYFAQVLTRNQVAVESGRSPAREFAAQAAEVRDESGQENLERPLAETSAVQAGAEGASGMEPPAVYIVEASPQQLENVLAELQNDHTDVLTVNVDPAPQVPAQQELTNFGRGYAEPAAQVAVPAAGADAVQSYAEPAPAAASTAPSPAGNIPVAQSPPAPPLNASEVPIQLRMESANRLRGRAQNQIRSQIPVKDQQRLYSALEDLSTEVPAEAPDEAAAAGVRANRSVNARARQIELEQLRQIAGALPAEGYQAPATPELTVTQDQPPDRAANIAKSARSRGEPAAAAAGAAVGQPDRRFAKPWQYQVESQPARAPAPGAQQQAVAPPLPTSADAPAEESRPQEPRVKAVFVIQAAQVPAVNLPADQTPAPNEAPAPAATPSP
ncbi:MAG: zf-HC2 domain-containing protein [Planctomycetaceae bacterium]|nr:zf-HC2 domain-containing protein [Planctomycetaceae bacterium]